MLKCVSVLFPFPWILQTRVINISQFLKLISQREDENKTKPSSLVVRHGLMLLWVKDLMNLTLVVFFTQHTHYLHYWTRINTEGAKRVTN